MNLWHIFLENKNKVRGIAKWSHYFHVYEKHFEGLEIT